MSLLSAAERLAAMDRSAVKFSVERCLHTQDRYSSCTACFDICPAEAIQPGKPPALLSDTCRNCLVCLAMCPMGAYQADDGISALLTCVTRTDTKIIELVCEKHSNAEMGKEDGIAIRIKGCLAGLGSGTYLMLAALGVEQIIVRLDDCANCEWAGLREQVEKQAAQAQQLLSMWGKTKNVVCWSEKPMVLQRPLWEAANPPLSRRDLFRMAAQQGKIAMARAMENKNINAQKGMGNNRRRMLGAIEHLAAPSNVNPMPLQDLGFANISISDLCTACGACANACPTQALSFKTTDDNSNYELSFLARNCIGCETCIHVCAPAAISIDHNPNFEQVFGNSLPDLIKTGKLVRCSRCHTLMAEQPGTDLCPLCEYRKNQPFGSKLPPGVKIPGR